MYYQGNSAEHHKAISILHAVEIPWFFRKKNRKQNKQKYCCSLKLKDFPHYSLLEDITHY